MKLAVYQYCDESQRRSHELSIRFAWCDQAPQRDEVIAMGDEADWQIADVATYAGNGALAEIYVVSLYRGTLPAREDWELLALKAAYPEQSLQIQISDMGSDVLGFETTFLNQVPTVGSHLIRYGIREDTFVTRREEWKVSAVEVFTAIEENVPFQQIYLVFHKVAQHSLTVQKSQVE
ncbi:MAG: hypothetical protein AAFN40_16990 [Cyanobacteria bacterium J06560_6]